MTTPQLPGSLLADHDRILDTCFICEVNPRQGQRSWCASCASRATRPALSDKAYAALKRRGPAPRPS